MVTGPSALANALTWTDDPSRDAMWFEFCWPPFPDIIESTNFGERRIIMRIHRIEAAETMHVANMNWEKIDDVIVVGSDMRQRVVSAAPEIDLVTRVHVLPNGVDIARFGLAPSWNKFKIGWCGLMTLRKNPILALQIFYKLHKIDQNYTMNFCGMGRDPFVFDIFKYSVEKLGLSDVISWDGNVSQTDMPSWHADNGVLLHTSIHESFGYAIAEAACTGCDIAIFDHPGAQSTWPSATIFCSVDQAVDMILKAQPGRWRSFVADNYSLDQQLNKLSSLLNKITTTKSL